MPANNTEIERRLWDAADEEKMPEQDWTEQQGQYLAYIYNYTQMVLKLEERGFITREPGKPRTIRVVVRPDQLPYRYLRERSPQGRRRS